MSRGCFDLGCNRSERIDGYRIQGLLVTLGAVGPFHALCEIDQLLRVSIALVLVDAGFQRIDDRDALGGGGLGLGREFGGKCSEGVGGVERGLLLGAIDLHREVGAILQH
ncbi:hypothetical protein D9M68_871970 [compost metagenome]